MRMIASIDGYTPDMSDITVTKICDEHGDHLMINEDTLT